MGVAGENGGIGGQMRMGGMQLEDGGRIDGDGRLIHWHSGV